MVQQEINKGVGRTVEFKDLKAQYFFLFARGLLAVFFPVVVLYLCGIDQIVCLGLDLMGATLVVWQTFAMNRKCSRYGLMRQGAIKVHPCYLLNRCTVFHLIRNLKSRHKA